MNALLLINASYFVTAFLFIMGLKRMSSPKTARSGILWAGAGMVVATAATFVSESLPAISLGRLNQKLVLHTTRRAFVTPSTISGPEVLSPTLSAWSRHA